MSFWRPRRPPPPPAPPPTGGAAGAAPAAQGTGRFRLSVCKGPDCRRGGSEALFQAARESVAAGDAGPGCTVLRGGCYGLCHLGPNVVVREDHGRPKDPLSPEDYQLMGWEGEVHYAAMTPEKLVRVIREHLREGRVVEALTARFHQVLPRRD